MLRIGRGDRLSPPSSGLNGRPTVLRPRDEHHPTAIVNSEGIWLRVARPQGRSTRIPNIVPAFIEGEPLHPADDPHELTDEV